MGEDNGDEDGNGDEDRDEDGDHSCLLMCGFVAAEPGIDLAPPEVSIWCYRPPISSLGQIARRKSMARCGERET